MLTENQIEMLGDKIAPLYQQLEQDIIADIARRVKKTGRYTETAELMAQAMAAKGESPAKIRAEVMRVLRADKAYQEQVAKNTLEYKKQAVKDIRATERKAKKIGDEIIANAGDMSYNSDLSMWEKAGQKLTKDSAFTHLVEEMASVTGGSLKNITQTSGFKGAHGMVSVKNAYTNALDKAILKMSTGTFSYDQAVTSCVMELAHSGLRSIDYASGKSYQLDTAARMCVRTACHQLSAKISMKHCDDMGTDLVEVSEHWGARPEHALWQGKIYSRSGKNKKYPNFSACHYGAVDGLCGINCRHTFYPFFEGISTPNTWKPEPSPKQYNGKTYTYYQATQKQRQMERNIRDTKREIEAGKVLGVDVSDLEAKKRRQIAEYRGFSKAMDIRAKDNRLRVVSGSNNIKKTSIYAQMNKSIAKSQDKFDTLEVYRKGNTHRKTVDGIEIIDESTYNKLIRNVKKNGGTIIRGTSEVEEHLAKNGSTASCIGDVLLFSKNATVSDVLEETYHFRQNFQKLNYGKPAKERLLLNEIDAQNYLLSVAEKYNIPESELSVTRKNLEDYKKALEEYYESHK